MKRRSFFQLLWGGPMVILFPPETLPEPAPYSGPEPLHECVDRPELPRPACAKWTGDPLAIQTSHRRRAC
ncbi:MAG: hypothetical protein WBQ68_12000 [Terriglobales bacterium]